jgi:hypothetical protein
MDGNLGLLLAVGASFGPHLAETELSAEIHAHELRAHVYRLTSTEFGGRRGAGAARASRHIADAFARLGLKPAFDGSFFQDVPPGERKPNDKADFLGRNVVAVLEGGDPKLKHEWVVLACHFDHLGRKGDVLYPGADDNASGVALLLEVAEYFALCGKKPRRTLVFASFDLEEVGLLGSNHFIRQPPLPLKDCKAFVTADLVGRSLGDVMDEYLFVVGSECSPGMRRLAEGVKPAQGLKLARVGADIVGTRSDYGPFRDRQVPFLFLTTGPHADYHRPTDLPERLNYVKLERVARWARDAVSRLADDDVAPAWEPLQAPDFDEARVLLTLVKRVLARVELYPLSGAQRELLDGVVGRAEKIVERGKITVEERAWVASVSKLLLATLF